MSTEEIDATSKEAMLQLPSNIKMDYSEIEQVAFRLKEADLGIKRFLKVGNNKPIPTAKHPDGEFLDKAAFETGFQNNLYECSKENLETWPRWGLLGGNYLVLIDYDKKETYDIISKRLPETFEVTSPRRQLPHQYFVVWTKENQKIPNLKFHIPGDTYVNAKGATVKNPSGEIRADNYYTVAPGATIRYQDIITDAWKIGTYRITKNVKIAGIEYDDFMKAVNGYLMEPAGERVLTDEKLRYGVSTGERHDTIFRFACRLVGDNPDGGLPATAALEMLEHYNNTKLFDEQGNLAPVETPYLKRVIREGIEKASKNSGFTHEQIALFGFTQLREKVKKGEIEQKKLPNFWDFCEKDEKGNLHFKPAKAAEWLKENKNFKTDYRTEIIYYYDGKRWIPNAGIRLKELLGQMFGKENRESYYSNVKHHLISISLEEVKFSEKIAVENGLLDVETQTLTEFNADEMPFYEIPVFYNKMVIPEKLNNWLEFLKQVTDPEDIPLLQEWFGYCLLPDYRFHKALWIHGEGRNGKGVYDRTIKGIIGNKNVSTVGLEQLDGNHRFALKDLYGKLYNSTSEPTTNRVFRTELFQKITGADLIQAEFKTSNNLVEFVNCSKVTIIGNKFPRIDNPTTAFKDRMMFVKFPHYFSDKDRIPNLENVWLNDPEQKSAILNWALEGLHRLIENGQFTQTKTQQETEIAFNRVANPPGAFIMEKGIIAKNLVTTRAINLTTFQEYCEDIGVTPDQKALTQSMQRLAPKVKDGWIYKPKKERAWIGWGLKDVEQQPIEQMEQMEQQKTLSRILDNTKIGENKSGVPSVPSVPSVPPVHFIRLCDAEKDTHKCDKCNGKQAEFKADKYFLCPGCFEEAKEYAESQGAKLIDDTMPDIGRVS